MSECVKVIVRCRPMNQREKDLSCKCCLNMVEDRAQCTIQNVLDPKAPPKSFTFDGTYFTDSTTENIYNDIAYPLVEGVTEGYNGTIFAYGQTGCGKSFTMQGINDPPTQRGIIPRAFDHIFETVSCEDSTKFLIHASYCEIYNEEIRDLLGKDVKAKLDLHEHPEKGVYVNGLSQHPVHNVVECNKIMERGWKNRATGATLMNADSSRSHSIFTINLEMMTPDDSGEEHIRAGKLNLVDLAGSERQSKTGATGDRLKEATKINLSLSALGNVISALVDGKSKHIPYRDSKLTRLLQDSLGGNTKTLMVACLSPADNNYDETLSTLRYANRAKNIKNKPKINEDPKDALLRQYQEEIQKLKAMLMGQIPVPKGGFDDVMNGDFSAPAQSSQSQSDDDLRDQLEREKEQIKELDNDLRDQLEREKEPIKEEYDRKLEEMQRQYEEEKVTKVKLEQDMKKLRKFYDEKLSNVDGQLEKIPSTAEPKRSRSNDFQQMRMEAFNDLMEAFRRTHGVGLTKPAGETSEESKEERRSKKKAGVAGAAGAAGAMAGGAVAGKTAPGGTATSGTTVQVQEKVVVVNADGTPAKDAQGKVITKIITKTVTKTEYVQGEREMDDIGRPDSVMGENLPEGPNVEGMRLSSVSDMSEDQSGRSSTTPVPKPMVPTQSQSQTAIAHPDQDKKVNIVNGQMVIRSMQASGDESIIIRPTQASLKAQQAQGQVKDKDGNYSMQTEGEGMVAPRSSPTNGSTEQIRFQQQEAMKRLEEIQKQMVGGEKTDNKELKEKRKKKKTYAEERKRRLAEAIAKMDDDGIMLEIYDNIGDELKAKNTILQKEKEKNEALNREILDIQSEHEFEKIDYLDTIRQQDRNLKLLQEIIDRIQPGIRRDCNYYNIDKIKMQSKWDENEQKWIMPKLLIERTSLPGDVTTFPKAVGRGKIMANGYDHDDNFQDSFRPKIMKSQDNTGEYFRAKRQNQLVQDPLERVDIGEVRKSYNLTQPAMPNGVHRNSLLGDEPMSSTLQAAKVHGQLYNTEEGMARTPGKLEPLSMGKKPKKKKSNNSGF